MSGRYPNHMTLLLKILSAKQDRLIKNSAMEMQKILTCNLWRRYPLNVDKMIPKKFLQHWWDRFSEFSGKAKTTSSKIDVNFNELNNSFANLFHTGSYEDSVLVKISLNDAPQVQIHLLYSGLNNIKSTACGADKTIFWVLENNANNLAKNL